MTITADTRPVPLTLLSPKVLIPFIIVTLIWGSTWIVIRDQLGGDQGVMVPASWSVCYRFLVAGIAMALLALLRRETLWLSWRGQVFAMILGTLQFAVNFNFVYRAEGFITSGLVAVLFALLIVPNTLLTRLIIGTRVERRFLAGGAIAVVGIGLLLLHEARNATLGTGAVVAGAALTLAGVLSASVANVMQATPTGRAQQVIPMLAWAMLWGTLANALFALATVGTPVVDLRPAYLLGVLYLGIAGSVICFPLYFGIIRNVGAGTAAWSSVLIPVIAMGFSTLLEGYAWSGLTIAGALLALTGLVVAVMPRQPVMDSRV
jgi:drug/metabolite transporter (DMT)-like permease